MVIGPYLYSLRLDYCGTRWEEDSTVMLLSRYVYIYLCVCYSWVPFRSNLAIDYCYLFISLSLAHTRSMVVAVGTEIRYCIAQEMLVTLDLPFSFREGCFEFHCFCHSNGSWDCPAERSEYKCKLEPGQQIVRGKNFYLTSFRHLFDIFSLYLLTYIAYRSSVTTSFTRGNLLDNDIFAHLENTF